ncbi:hypothetical protein K1X76_04910 [bacterium]|nr:hypothetical protein [bacterium]
MSSNKIPNIQTLKIISLALHFSLLMITGVCFFMGTQNGWVMEFIIQPDKSFFFYAMLMAASVSVLLIVTWPFFTLHPPSTMDEAKVYYQEREKSPFDRMFYDFKNPTQDILAKTIIRMAGCESVALFGFVAAFLNQAPLLMLPFSFVALTLQFIFGPIYGSMRSGQ